MCRDFTTEVLSNDVVNAANLSNCTSGDMITVELDRQKETFTQPIVLLRHNCNNLTLHEDNIWTNITAPSPIVSQTVINGSMYFAETSDSVLVLNVSGASTSSTIGVRVDQNCKNDRSS